MSEIVLGTAALGMRYGLGRTDGSETGLGEADAIALVQAALAGGIQTFDTAPAYGDAERRLGLALGERGRVWTKISSAAQTASSAQVDASIAASLRSLARQRIDVLQWHNWTRDLAEAPSFRQLWSTLASDPRVAALGASTYGVDDASAAVTSGLFRHVQVEWNILNQGVLTRIGALAREHDVAIAVRSVLLQGALTNEGRTLPALPHLAEGVTRAGRLAESFGMSLEDLATRAALSQEGIRYVIIGMDRVDQVKHASTLVDAEPLSSAVMAAVRALDMAGHPAADPRTWAAG